MSNKENEIKINWLKGFFNAGNYTKGIGEKDIEIIEADKRGNILKVEINGQVYEFLEGFGTTGASGVHCLKFTD